MPKAAAALTSFNSGELSPLLEGRTDLAKYASGCRTLENFIPTVQGPARRRPGTRYAGTVKTPLYRPWLVRFEFSVTQAYILEFGPYYIRFWANHGPVLSDGVPYEIVSPYSAADLQSPDLTCALRYVQSGDVMYLAHPNHPVHKLSRYGPTTWTLAPLVTRGGPFADANTVRAMTVYASATVGAVTLTASAGLFSALDVGRLFYLEQRDGSYAAPWESREKLVDKNMSPYGLLRRSDGKTYQCVSTFTDPVNPIYAGSTKPIHTYGIVADGMTRAEPAIPGTVGVQWLFLDPGFGYLQITAVQSSTVATATVVGDWGLPAAVVGSANASWRWAFGAWGTGVGYPTAVAFFRERLVFSRGQEIWMSVAGDYENFAAKDDGGQVVADQAIRLSIESAQVNEIQWLSPGNALIAGTSGGEFAVGEIQVSEPLGPGNVQAKPQSAYGSRAIQALRIGDQTLFVQRAGRKLRSLSYSFQDDRYVSADCTVLSEHITASGLIAMAYQQETESILWGARVDGTLVGLTFSKEQDPNGVGALGWHRHVLGGGLVECIETIPSPAGDHDELWMVVVRIVAGQGTRYIEYLDAPYERAHALKDALYLDCAATYSGAPATVISGLDYLEGWTVEVLADGAAHPPCTVSAGHITLQRPASTVQVGLACPATLETMRIEAGGGDGTAQGKSKRLTAVTFRLLDTVGGEAGPALDRLDLLEFRRGADRMDAAPPPFTGDKLIVWPEGYETEGRIVYRQAQPFPATVVAIYPVVTTFDR